MKKQTANFLEAAALFIALAILFSSTVGCDEEMNTLTKPVIDEVLTDDNKVPVITMAGETKQEQEAVPSEPVTEKPIEEPTGAAELEDTTEPEPPADITPPTVVEIAWYGDHALVEPIPDAVYPGDPVYVKVVFSEPVEQVVADDATARPVLFITTDAGDIRYRVRAHYVRARTLESGDCKPLSKGAAAYLCKYTVSEKDFGTVALKIGGAIADETGDMVTELPYTAPFVVEEFVIEEPEPAIVLPDGYMLPAYLIPQEETVLSDYERTMIEDVNAWEKQRYPDFDPFRPTLQTQAGYPADLISLLPYKDREEVYDLFVASVNLPFFAEAAELLKESNLNHGTIWVESYRTGSWKPLQDFRRQFNQDLRLIPRSKIADVWFEENPQDVPYREGYSHSYYWIYLEWYRLQLQYPHLRDGVSEEVFLEFFRESARNGYVFGLDNPWI